MNRNEELQKAQEEFDELRKWVLAEEEKIEERLKREGKYRGGLDGNNRDFIPLHEEYRRRIREIKKKYRIPEKREK